ncbi:protein TRI1-like [Gastrolobium bilobum]|uniref:protein TRI1-like n=1 Tax=Gastrolobium bilobum TaxID=150636 RepID=UPI002AB1904A|nr:protein TRI1-like [Gastrolobium bilobum]
MAAARVFGACAGRALMAAAAKGGAAAAKKVAASGGEATIKTAKKTVSNRSRSSPNAGIQKVVPVSSELGKFLGSPEVSRTDAVKRVWEYIKHQNLQNPTNKKEIFCDEKLKTIFDGKDKVGFTEIARLLSNHFVKSG